jgi:hypothetical protein
MLNLVTKLRVVHSAVQYRVTKATVTFKMPATLSHSMHTNVILLSFRKLWPSLPPFTRNSNSRELGAHFLHKFSPKSHNKLRKCEEIFIYTYTLIWNMALVVLCCTKLTFGTFRRHLCTASPKSDETCRKYHKIKFTNASLHKECLSKHHFSRNSQPLNNVLRNAPQSIPTHGKHEYSVQ